MFSGTNEEAANLIAQTIMGIFDTAFVSEHSKAENDFNPLKDFWVDKYIIGFTHEFIELLLEFEFNGQTMHSSKKEEIIRLAAVQICEENWKQVLLTANKLALDERVDSEFTRGAKHAEILYGFNSGHINPDNNDPILQEARMLAKKMRNEAGLGSSLYNSIEIEGSIGGALMLLTVIKHIKSKYLN